MIIFWVLGGYLLVGFVLSSLAVRYAWEDCNGPLVKTGTDFGLFMWLWAIVFLIVGIDKGLKMIDRGFAGYMRYLRERPSLIPHKRNAALDDDCLRAATVEVDNLLSPNPFTAFPVSNFRTEASHATTDLPDHARPQ